MRLSHASLKVARALLESARPLAGSDLFKETGVGAGTIYPLLARFETAGWVEADWETVSPQEAGRPRKRLYRLTGLGQREARAALAALQPTSTATVGGFACAT